MKDLKYVDIFNLIVSFMEIEVSKMVKVLVLFFLFGVLFVVLMGVVFLFCLVFDGKLMGMVYIIEIIMFLIGVLIIFICKLDSIEIIKGFVFYVGMCVVIVIFGIVWLGDILM